MPRGNKKLLFVGHLFHQTTKSSAFFIELLRKLYSVTTRFDDSYNVIPSSKANTHDYNSFDKIVVWQVLQPAIKLASLCPDKLIYVPMADSMWEDGSLNVDALKNVRVLCFSSKQYYDLQKQGFKRLLCVRYAPAPRWDMMPNYNSLRPFFWQRRKEPSWMQVVNMLSGLPYESLTLEWKTDGDPLVPPTEYDKSNYRIEMVPWQEERYKADAILRKCNLYFAPRIEEGIGMSFLDAMAMGLVVIAPDSFTMNEYITNGYDGILYQKSQLGRRLDNCPKSNSLLACIGDNAIHKIDVIHRHWEGIEKDRIKQWIAQ